MTTARRVVVIGASAGGIEALKTLVSGLPATLPASVLVVQHSGPGSLHVLDKILTRAGSLTAEYACDGEEIRDGTIRLAPPDRHLTIDAGGERLRITGGPRENGFRPAADPLFRSAAAALGTRVIGIVLTGWLDDGTAGLAAIRERGGIAIVQNPEEAAAPSMPLSALKAVEVNHCVPLARIAPLLEELTGQAAPAQVREPVPATMRTEVDIAQDASPLDSGIMAWGKPSPFACPECRGVLRELKERNDVRYRCHTGHAYSASSLLAELKRDAEDALGSAIRAMNELERLLRRLTTEARARGADNDASIFAREADAWRSRGEFARRNAAATSGEPERTRT